MKSVQFDYVRPSTIPDALRMLASDPQAKILAGGQTLGPMLNLRLAQPALLVDITRIPELASVREESDAISIGATVTHAAIEDGRVRDPAGGFLRRVACGIAYRAVRNRGTVGGSLAHADPAADWLSCLCALGAEVTVANATGSRRTGLASFVRGAMETELGADEMVVSVRVPKFSSHARFGFHKICRKAGEFADAIGVAAHDPERNIARLVASTATGAPIVLEAPEFRLDHPRAPDTADLKRRFTQAGLNGDAYDLTLHAVAVRRAIQQMTAA